MILSFGYCIVCFDKRRLVKDIRTKGEDGLTIDTKLKITLPEYGLLESIEQRSICRKCLDDLDVAYRFKKQCVENFTILNEFVQQRLLKSTKKSFVITPDDISEYKNSKTSQKNNNFDTNLELGHDTPVDDKISDSTSTVEQSIRKRRSDENQYECSKCGMGFRFRSALREHTRIHLGKKQFLCKYCPYKHTSLENIKVHVLKIHPRKKQFEFAETSVPNIENSSTETDLQTENTVNNFLEVNIVENEFEKLELFPEIGDISEMDLELQAEVIIKSTSDEDILEDKIVEISIPDIENNSENMDTNFVIKTEMDVDDNQIFVVTINADKFEDEANLEAKIDDKDELTGKIFEEISVEESNNESGCSSKDDEEKSGQERNSKIHRNEPPFVCNVCGKKFVQQYKLKRHSQRHTGERPYHCTNCPYKCFTSQHLKRHMRSHLRQSIKSPKEGYSNCRFCSKTFTTKGIKNHETMHVRVKDPYKCEVCGKIYASRSTLRVHRLRHKNIRTYQCKVCGFKFVLSCDLKRHVRTHTEEKPYQCAECPYRSFTKACLRKHIQSNHKKKIIELNYNQSDLDSEVDVSDVNRAENEPDVVGNSGNIDLTTETDVGADKLDDARSLKAKIGDKNELTNLGDSNNEPGCSSKDNNETNELFPENSEGKYSKCPDCSRRVTASGLRRHTLMHAGINPFVCDICGITSANLRTFRYHKTTHRNEFPHHCKFCGKRFPMNYMLQNHMLSHTEERPYQCTVCPYKSKTMWYLQKHINSHTKEKPIRKKRASKKNKIDSQTKLTAKDIPDIDIVENKIDDLEGRTEIISEILNDKSANENTEIELKSETAIKNEISDVNPEDDDKIYELTIDLDKLDDAKTNDDKTEENISKKPDDEPKSSAEDQQKKDELVSPENAVSTSKPSKKYKCPCCSKMLSHSTLRTHKILRLGLKPFCCKICEKNFENRKSLQEHNEIHKNERRFACTYCPYKCKTNNLLQKHIVCHTKENPIDLYLAYERYGDLHEIDEFLEKNPRNQAKKSDKIDENTTKNGKKNAKFEPKRKPDVDTNDKVVVVTIEDDIPIFQITKEI